MILDFNSKREVKSRYLSHNCKELNDKTMKKTLLILAFTLGVTQTSQAQNSYPIDGKWTYEASLNTMYIFDNGIRYTYYCIGSNCDSLYQTYQAGDTNAIPGTNPYAFENETLTIDLHFGNELVTPVTFECDGDKARFVTPGYNMLRVGTNCSTTGIGDEEINYKNRELVKVIDLLGKETEGVKNQPLFYIYDDGTVEKKIILE